jgi:beta-galactosidase
MAGQAGALSTGPSRERLSTGWLFGGSVPLPGPEDGLNPEVVREYSRADLDDSGWSAISLPHTVTPLSWELWSAGTWEKVWAYRRPITIESRGGDRFFLDFDGAVTSATVTFNDVVLGEHRGGYLPFSFEVTELVREGSGNLLAVILDSRFNINVPPNAPDMVASSSIDFYQPGGIPRDVWLRRVPQTYVASIATTHSAVLDPSRRSSTFGISIDSAVARTSAQLVVELVNADGDVIAGTTHSIEALDLGTTEVALELSGLERVELWDVDSPTLYTVVASLTLEGEEVSSLSLRTGYRDAEFRKDGFFLNGKRRYLMGVNRHEYFPFAGFAMPARVHRRDAEIIRNELNCLMVRCAHYPQTTAFLDACDELGLLVWEESPGWHYIGNSDWQDSAVRDITEMIARDRHRPSIVVWGARLNETPDSPAFYARTEALVKSLDPTRATSGATCGDYSRSMNFQHDVFSYDDYNTRLDDEGQRRPDLLPPVEDRPYLVSESVAARSSPTTHYRRSETPAVQQHQALDYANAHNDAQGDKRYSGLLAWLAFDYNSPRGNGRRGVRMTGLTDIFRIPKPGAATYRAQISPKVRVVIEPAFAWESTQFGNIRGYNDRPELQVFGPDSPALIASNCDRLEIFLGGEKVADSYPDRERFPHLDYAPFFVDLGPGKRSPALRIDGYLGDDLALSRSFEAGRDRDRLVVAPDDGSLVADGVDATRVVIGIADRYGNLRTSCGTQAIIQLSGPAELIGEPTLYLDDTGAVAAVWVRTVADEAGEIIVRVEAPGFGSETATIRSTR